MRIRSALAAITVLVAACASPVPSVMPSSDPTAAPTTHGSVTPAPTPMPTPSPDLGRPDPGPDAPAIADPYWLGVGSPGSSTVTDASGTITHQHHTMTYQVIEGGRVEGDTILDGRIVGSVGWTVIDIDDGRGDDPMLEQVGGFDGDPEQVTIDGTDVYFLRSPDAAYFAAYWWEPGQARYFTVVVSEATDLELVTEALIRS
jgi:hypothetical protein